ncbi:MAG: cyanophycinase [Bacteroidota bacterium]
MRIYILLIPSVLLSFIYACSLNQAQPADQDSPGVEGTLLIIGGGRLDPVFFETFLAHAGGPGADIVVIPTAMGDEQIARDSAFSRVRALFQEYGFGKITILHTRDPQEADTKEFAKPLKTAGGVWFVGGRQWRLADSYLNNRTHEALNKLLKRGGVIAGTSAGATIQGSYLARGDTKTNTIMMGDHEEGLGFFPNVAIDQHLLARNRQFDLFEILDVHPELLGIGLDENTGILVQEDHFKVLGASHVAIYDGTRWSRDRDTIYQLPSGSREFYFLHQGQQYNWKLRTVVQK